MKENRKKTVIKKSSVGYAQCRILRDNNGNSVDYRFISVNDCFWQLMGLEGSVLIGKTILQIDPNTEKAWIEICGNVALSGESERFESFSSDSGKYVETTICSTNIGEVAIIIVDITARKRLENALKESESRLIAAQKNGPCRELGIEFRDQKNVGFRRGF